MSRPKQPLLPCGFALPPAQAWAWTCEHPTSPLGKPRLVGRPFPRPAMDYWLYWQARLGPQGSLGGGGSHIPRLAVGFTPFRVWTKYACAKAHSQSGQASRWHQHATLNLDERQNLFGPFIGDWNMDKHGGVKACW